MEGKRMSDKGQSQRIECAYDELVPIGKLVPNPRNPNQHSGDQITLLAKIIKAQGWRCPVTASTRSGYIVRGHGRLLAAHALGLAECPTDYQDYASDAEEWADLIADNRLSELSGFDMPSLKDLLEELDTGAFDMDLTGFTADALEDLMTQFHVDDPPDIDHASLQDRFIVPPFSVLDARQGYWQERKRGWLALGIQSELGRGDGITCAPSDAMTDPSLNLYRKRNGENLTWVKGGRDYDSLDDVSRKILAAQPQSGTSIFDPVLCELAYRWFCPQHGKVLDPFAGGSVRGIVAAYLGYDYTGVELRPEQVAANRQQAKALSVSPIWIVGDSIDIATLAPGEYDLVFSCPPYHDLEVYSDLLGELSAMPYPDFLAAYRSIIAACCTMLKPNRFAVWVVGEVRDKQGFYRNFVGDTVRAFLDAGMSLYNEAVLVTAVGSLPIRVAKQFQTGRKLGKTHQNVLIFYKGDPKTISQFGEVEIGNIEDPSSYEGNQQIGGV